MSRSARQAPQRARAGAELEDIENRKRARNALRSLNTFEPAIDKLTGHSLAVLADGLAFLARLTGGDR